MVPTGSKTAGHRLSEVLVQRQVEDDIRQVERRAERVQQERRDHEACRDGRRQRCPDEPADGETDPGERRGGQPEHAHPQDGIDDVAGLRRDADPDEDREDEAHHADRGHHPEPALDRPSRARQRRRQHDVEPAPALVARPAGEEAGARQPEDERAEAEERELQQTGWLGEVDIGVDRLDQRADLRDRSRSSRRRPRADAMIRSAYSPPRHPTRWRCRPGRRAGA